MLYLIFIFICSSLVLILNTYLNPMFPWWVYLLWLLVYILAAFVMDALVAIVIRKLPERLFDYHKKIFHNSPKTIKFFQMVGVQTWKDKVPELGQFTKFRKNKIADPRNPEYLKRFILEACYGIVIHELSVPFSFLIIFLDYGIYNGTSNIWLTIGVPVAVVNAVLIYLPAMILRYNLPKLVRLYEKSLKKSEENK